MSNGPRDVEKMMYTKSPQKSISESFDSSKTLQEGEKPDARTSVAASVAPINPGKVSDGPASPPNGGLQAWLQVAGSFFLYFNCLGLINAYGVFQTYYEDNPYWTRNASDISWIGSVQAFLLLSVGVISGPLYDIGYFRHLIITGAFFVSFGFMMTSLCREYWQVMLAQGIVVGIGNGCLFVPSIAILPQYFTTRKALANGIAASGSSIGGIIYPIVFRRLLVTVGFGWATRVLGFIALVGLLFSIGVMKPRIKPQGRRQLFQPSAFKELPYLLFTIAMVFAFMGYYAPLYYVQTYAITKGITGVSLGFYLLPILNAAAVPGRILPNILTDLIGPFNVLIPALTISAIMCFAWIGMNSAGAIIVFCLLYGFFSGAFASLPPVCLVTLTKDMRFLGTRMGQTFFAGSFGLLIGSPVCGVIYERSGSFLGLQLFSALCLMMTCVFLIGARIAAVGAGLKTKV